MVRCIRWFGVHARRCGLSYATACERHKQNNACTILHDLARQARITAKYYAASENLRMKSDPTLLRTGIPPIDRQHEAVNGFCDHVQGEDWRLAVFLMTRMPGKSRQAQT